MVSSNRRSLAEKLKALMAGCGVPDGRTHTSRSLSASVNALPDEYPSVSNTAVFHLAKGSQDNPTVNTVMALCRALDIPPAHLLPHESYDDLEALTAFEDPLARRFLVLLKGLPRGELQELIKELERRRADLGLQQATDSDASKSQGRRQRRRSKDEAARYAADALEGL
ncbi:hypothetical protein [Streptomyces sp. NPDC052042]|uniref:hypothetical protein n=1 Tax=Streptomyces sp. NPDC052042 TaxID=3365683 RepID=UPI0037D307E8